MTPPDAPKPKDDDRFSRKAEAFIGRRLSRATLWGGALLLAAVLAAVLASLGSATAISRMLFRR